ncbi:MAG: glycosyltransferase family 2 protein [Burkholderiaceae bacterium]|nr:glycosyltransferase family 2 protein [Burkholderiaceae bacterium]
MEPHESVCDVKPFNPCVLIPVYNHEHAVGKVLEDVLRHNVACVLVDDGSSTRCKQTLDALQAENVGKITLIRHTSNRGKGAAVLTGMRYAAAAGFSHVLQIDADGQHCTDDIPVFLQQSREAPSAVIAGYPVYDESVPELRFYARYLTHIWVWVNTLSMQIRDSMCGFRVYPLGPTIRLIKSRPIRQRMAFDTDIIVRLFWEGVTVINQPTRIRYPSDGISHFRMWADNVQISCMHASLFFGMLLKFPQLLRRKWGR